MSIRGRSFLFYVLAAICVLLGACLAEQSPTPPGPSPAAATPTATRPPPTPSPSETPTSGPTATTEPRTLTVCMGAEPDTLYHYGGRMLAAQNVLSAVYDGPIDRTEFGYEPVILKKLPSLADGDALIRTIAVNEGDMIVGADGIHHQLWPGVRYRPAGCRSADCAVEYAGGVVEMDQLVARYTMLSDLRWSDGYPLTASDSVFSFRTASSRCDLDWDGGPEDTFSCGYLGEGNALENTASYTLLDELSVEWAGLPGFLDPYYQTNFAHPLPAHQLVGYDAQDFFELAETRLTPLGWGPYQIIDWEFGEEIRLERNPFYFRAEEGLPHFDRLVFKPVGGEDRNIDMLLSGRCDILDLEASIYQDFETLIGLQNDGAVALDFRTGTVWEHIDFGIRPSAYDDGYQPGSDRPDFFGDVRTRQAIAHCIDRGAIEQQVLGGFPSGISTYIPTMHPLANANAPTYPFDPVAAAALLDEVGWIDHDGDPGTPRVAQGIAGVPDGIAFAIDYWTTTSETRGQVAEIIKSSLAGCGIEVELTFWDAEEFFTEEEGGPVFGRQFDLAAFAWLADPIPACDLFTSANIPGPPEAVDADGGLLHPSGWSGFNISGFSNPEFDRACRAALALLPGEPGFLEAHGEAQAIFARELPVLPLYLRLGRLGFFTVARPDLCHHAVDSNGTDFRHIEEYELGPGC